MCSFMGVTGQRDAFSASPRGQMADNQSGLSLDTVLCPSEGLDFVLVSDNELLVQFGTRSRPSELFRDNDLSGMIGSIVSELLVGPAPVGRLLACVGEGERADALKWLESLVEQGLISDIAR